MSTATQQQEVKRKLFAEASAAKLPKLVCTGYVAKIGEGKESKKGVYNVNLIEINGIGASKNARVYFLSRPEWFAVDDTGYPTFRPEELENVEGGDKMLFVYRNNFRSRGSSSVLRGVCGSEERFMDLQEKLLGADGVDDAVLSPEVIEDVFTQFLLPKEGENAQTIGYILKQQSTKTDELDADGKIKRILENRYEVESFFDPTAENLAKYRKSAEKSADRAKEMNKPLTFKVCFDEGTPF